MIDCTLGFRRMVTAGDLKALVGELDGRWYDQDGECLGVIEVAGARVWAYPPAPAEASPTEAGAFEVGGPIHFVATMKLTILEDQRSPGTASHVIEAMLLRWDGIELKSNRLCTPDDWW